MKPERIELANRRQQPIFVCLGLFLFAYGLFLPSEWRGRFGVLAEPTGWFAENVPSIGKVASISPIAPLIEGFFGLSFLLIPFFYIALVRWDPIGLRFKYALSNAQSVAKFVACIYFLGLPVFLFLIYFVFSFPIDVSIGSTSSRGNVLFSLMVSHRFALALFGAVLVMGVCGFLWVVTIFVIGPISKFFLFEGDK